MSFVYRHDRVGGTVCAAVSSAGSND